MENFNRLFEHVIAHFVWYLLVPLVTAIGSYLMLKIRVRQEWHQFVKHDEKNGNFEKYDSIKCWRIGKLLRGTIIRQVPSDQNHKKWRIMARMEHEVVSGYFWNIGDDRFSFGTLLLRKEVDGDFRGFYIQAKTHIWGIMPSTKVAGIPLHWSRNAPKKHD